MIISAKIVRSVEKLVHLSDEEAEDEEVYKTAIRNQRGKVSENFMGMDPRFLVDKGAPFPIHLSTHNRAAPLQCIKNPANYTNSACDRYTEKIDSLITF